MSTTAPHQRLSWLALVTGLVLAQPAVHAQPVVTPGPPMVVFDPGLILAHRPVHIDASTPAPARALAEAIRAGRRVTLCNVDIDMKGYAELALEAGQSIVALAGCERSPTRRGPRIRVSDKRAGGVPLFIIRDSNVQLAGFQLQGPTPGIGSGTGQREYGIQVLPHPDAKPDDPGASPGTPKHLLHHVRITNMEIYHWSGAAIDLADVQTIHPQGRMTLANASGVRIDNNYIHHNRHYDGFGYGVNSGYGAYALVQANVFEENRHAMAGDSVSPNGLDFSGYVFHDNLILPGGGIHCTEGVAGTGVGNVCWRTHQIDMHGTKSTTLDGQHCCGLAGETMLIERNTILYQGGYRKVGLGPLSHDVWEWGTAIKIRGNPTGRVLVDANVFAHPAGHGAIVQNGDGVKPGPSGGLVPNITKPLEVTPNNLWDAKPLDHLQHCDFDGDGRPDAFMATGVNWWVRSAATGQWRYLSGHTEHGAVLSLRDVDGNGKCDVVLAGRLGLVGHYSPGGTGPWQPIGGTVGPAAGVR